MCRCCWRRLRATSPPRTKHLQLHEGVPMTQRVLIIDHSKQIHALIKSRLEGEGLELHSCFSAEQGIATAGQLLPDLILVDWEMPEIDGFEICRRLKSQ